MGFIRRSPQPYTRPPELRPPRSMWWWALPAALLVGAAVWGTSAWLLRDVDKLDIDKQVSTRIEAVRTALAAGAGVGAAVTLLLAVRRQRHLELTAAHTTHDAAERRVTELYTKAVEQLGNDQAPVRLGGLYALERLAQDTPALRQTIVDVICAYLRMPYTLPPDELPSAESAVPRVAIAGVSAPAGRDPHEERQVRLTAQRILAAHLRYDPTAPRRWWRPRGAPNPGHWDGINLDLTGATLIRFELIHCRAREVSFGGATFTGSARFGGATFTGTARFVGATFTSSASFGGVTFGGAAEFHEATFSPIMFGKATFTGSAGFLGATFASTALFQEATFTSAPGFQGVTFTSGVQFRGATGLDKAKLNGARVAPAASEERVWPLTWRVEAGEDGWQTLRVATSPAEGETADSGADPQTGE
ncbi:pentapeptide repeat-containing protein [Nonomuraea sp. NPDC003707]